MKKNDWILLGVICTAAGIFFLWHFLQPSPKSAEIQITVNGSLMGTYSLWEEQEIAIGKTNVLVISDGKAWMRSADCPDQICVRQKAVSKKGETIICLPNKVVVEVTEGETAEMDGVAN